ncbi:2533_t:CDS:2 [Acaulospora colombiana]|uniref:2533_t:CDS:1 n=1 Tax=Acaulospora colombiana TaxID=27376 RepID=A0ACA9LST0_9GLOM|nr:2533_t:CDS:2 [Acaulospora colombiana]
MALKNLRKTGLELKKVLFNTILNTENTPQDWRKEKEIILALTEYTWFGKAILKEEKAIKEMVTEEWYRKHRNSLRCRKILFFDQLLNDNKTRFLSWQQVYIRLGKQGCIPIWYRELKKLSKKLGTLQKRDMEEQILIREDKDNNPNFNNFRSNTPVYPHQ